VHRTAAHWTAEGIRTDVRAAANGSSFFKTSIIQLHIQIFHIHIQLFFQKSCSCCAKFIIFKLICCCAFCCLWQQEINFAQQDIQHCHYSPALLAMLKQCWRIMAMLDIFLKYPGLTSCCALHSRISKSIIIQLDIYILLCTAQQHIGQLAALLAMLKDSGRM
jgi:hypothetical protein